MERKLSKSSKVVVPTDKTNSFLTIEFEVYVRWVMENLEGTATIIEHERLTEIVKEAEKLLASMKDLTNDSEFSFVKESIVSKSIPTPKLLIKDHKKKDDHGEFIRRLVIPATILLLPSLSSAIWESGEFWTRQG